LFAVTPALLLQLLPALLLLPTPHVQTCKERTAVFTRYDNTLNIFQLPLTPIL
jgi:hypothetical protein